MRLLRAIAGVRGADLPSRLLAALGIGLAYAAFLTFDQSHWWSSRPDYAFGWLAPVFVVFIAADRWPRLRLAAGSGGGRPLARRTGAVVSTLAGLAFAGGMALFLLGALYRSMAGATQPGSIALAAGFPGVMLGLVYFNTPAGRVGDGTGAGWWTALKADAQLRAAGLFLLPACVWMLTAPLVTAVENAVSLFLLRQVVAVVFVVFDFLGFPLVREGNVLLLPRGQVGVAEACSGIRSLTGCLFAGSILAAVYLDRFWKKAALVGAALALAVLMNLLRSLFLTAWAYAYGSQAIEGPLHDGTGWAVLGLTTAGLFGLLPLFRAENWRRWIGWDGPAPAAAPAAGVAGAGEPAMSGGIGPGPAETASPICSTDRQGNIG